MSLVCFSLPNLFWGPLTAQPCTVSGCGRGSGFSNSHALTQRIAVRSQTSELSLTQLNSSFPIPPSLNVEYMDDISSVCLAAFYLGLLFLHPPGSWVLFTRLNSNLDTEILEALLPISFPKTTGSTLVTKLCHCLDRPKCPCLTPLREHLGFHLLAILTLVELDVSSLPALIYHTLCLFPWKGEEAILLSLFVLPKPCFLASSFWQSGKCGLTLGAEPCLGGVSGAVHWAPKSHRS